MSLKWRFILPLCLVCLAFTTREVVQLSFPAHFPAPHYDLVESPLTEEKIFLGRALFYDPILSRDSSTSCASCHSPFNAFAHTDHDLSHGIDDQIGTRNAPALFNLAWRRDFMWDGAVNHLDMQPLAPITDEKEMGETLENVVAKLQRHPKYPQLFQEAFGSDSVSGTGILKALSQFQLTLVSATSRYDSMRMGKTTFSQQEINGYRLFRENCSACHQEPLFTNDQFANNGLPVDTTLNDFGRYTITRRPRDKRMFKVPSLRNLSYSFPYMHDGRFNKLSQVINHYLSGIQPNPTLSPELEAPVQLTSHEKTDLIAFLLTLNDKSFVFDPSHQFPRNFFFPSEGLDQ